MEGGMKEKPISEMTALELADAIINANREWDELEALLEESGGASGSPFENLGEWLSALESERDRRLK